MELSNCKLTPAPSVAGSVKQKLDVVSADTTVAIRVQVSLIVTSTDMADVLARVLDSIFMASVSRRDYGKLWLFVLLSRW